MKWMFWNAWLHPVWSICVFFGGGRRKFGVKRTSIHLQDHFLYHVGISESCGVIADRFHGLHVDFSLAKEQSKKSELETNMALES